MEEKFPKNINELQSIFNTKKYNIKRYLVKYFKNDEDYIIKKGYKIADVKAYQGGHNYETINITQVAFDLIVNSYNLKNKYVTKVGNTTFVNSVLMSLENSTIGFIYNCLENFIEIQRQYKVTQYFIDLYIPEYKLAIECDENAHHSYGTKNELDRELFIKVKLGCKFIRYNPCDGSFDLSKVVNTILLETRK